MTSNSKWPLAVTVIMVTAMFSITALYIANRVLNATDRATHWTEGIAKHLGNALQTKVTVSNTSYTLDKKNIAELAVCQRRIVCVTKYESSFLGSKASVIIKGVYLVKAGFDLTKGCSIAADETGKTVVVSVPEPEILSNTVESQGIFFLDQGTLKKLPPSELAEAYRQNLEEAKLEAHNFGFLKEAKDRLDEKIQDLLIDYSTDVKVKTPVAPPPAPKG